jgi:integrase
MIMRTVPDASPTVYKDPALQGVRPAMPATLQLVTRRAGTPTAPTFAELLRRYEAEYLCDTTAASQASHGYVLRAFAERYGSWTLTRLTPAFFRGWRHELRQTNYNPGTIRTYLGYLGSVFTFAVQELEWLSENPLAKVRKPPEAPGRVRFLSDEERTRLLDVCQQSRQRWLYFLVVLAISTGCRRNEMLTLEWDQVDLEQGVLRLVSTKNKERRPVPVTGLALRLLREHAACSTSRWLFPGRDGQHALDIEKTWKKVRDQAGLVDFRFHDLRHTCASYLALNGATLREIAEILGHSRLQHTLRYAHLTLAHTTAVAARMTSTIFGEGDNTDSAEDHEAK